MVHIAAKKGSVTFTELLEKLGDLEVEHDGWLAHCPAHDDSQSSLRITTGDSGKVLLKCRAGCTNSAVMKALGYKLADLARMTVDAAETAPHTTSTDALPSRDDIRALEIRLGNYAAELHTPEGAAALDYAAQRFGIEPEDARRHGLGLATDMQGGPRLVVPFRDRDGQPLGFQARALNPRAKIRWQGPPNPEGASWAKIGYFEGSNDWPEVIITEGPGDALTASSAGYGAIAIRGAGLVANPNTIDQLVEVLGDGSIAVIAGDGDMAGREFSERLAASLLDRGIEARVLKLEDGKDLTDLRAEDPAQFTRALKQLIRASVKPSATPQSKADSEMDELKALWNERQYPLNDVGGALWLRDRLIATGKLVRYTGPMGFFQYQNGIWEQKSEIQMRTMVYDVGTQLRKTIIKARILSKDNPAAGSLAHRAERYADRANSSNGITAILTELKSLPGIYASTADFDRLPHLLAVGNGVIDLRTAELKAFDPAYLLTKRVEYNYSPTAPAPRWLQFLDEVFPDQPEVPEFLQRLIGYGITGATDEQVFVVNYGTGSNGKSLFTDTLTEVFTAITTTTPFSTFEARSSGGATNDLARLKGARLVMAAEGEQNKPMAEAVLKRITGRDKISARFLHREFFEFHPQFLLLMSSNYRPAFRGQDDGLWRRVRLLEWRRQFAPHERDINLPGKLLAEGEGILAWAVEGAKLWYKHGLQTPADINKVTADYRTQSDVLTGFFGGEWIAGTEADWVPRKALYESFRDYADAENMQDLSRWSSRAFYRAVEERGYPLRKRDGVFGFVKLKPGPGAHVDANDITGTLETSPQLNITTPPSTLSGPSLENFS